MSQALQLPEPVWFPQAVISQLTKLCGSVVALNAGKPTVTTPDVSFLFARFICSYLPVLHPASPIGSLLFTNTQPFFVSSETSLNDSVNEPVGTGDTGAGATVDSAL